MNITLTGPLDTEVFRKLSGLKLAGAPMGRGGIPLTALAAELYKRGHTVSIATLDSNIEAPIRLEEANFRVTYCPLRDVPKYKARVRALDLFEKEIKHLTAAIRSFDAEIVHAHWTYEYAEAAIRSGKRHVATMHDLGWDYFFHFRDTYRFIRLIMKYRTMIRVKRLTVVSPFMKSKAWQYGYFGPISVVPNGIDVQAFSPSTVEEKTTSPLRIVSVGNNGRIKNVMASVEAFAHVRERYTDAELHLFGPGLDSDFANGAPGVFAHGNVANGDLQTFLREKATILVHPSRLETFGIIVAEAKAAGVPVIVGKDSGGTVFVAGSADQGGVLADINSPREMAQAVLSIWEDRGVYRDMAQKAHEDVNARFTIETIAMQYVDIYEDILGKT